MNPIVGNQPSPSPDYPQEIKTLTGNIKLTSCGKNLFDKNKTADNYYYSSGGGTVVDGTNRFINQELPLSSSYAISFKSRTSGKFNAYVRIAEYNENGKFIKRTLISENNTILSIGNLTTKIISSVDAGPNAIFEELQIEQGSTVY